MPKRKAVELSRGTNRRQTRSSGRLADKQQPSSPTKKRRKAPRAPAVSTSKVADGRESSKENDENNVHLNEDDSSPDELNMLEVPASKGNGSAPPATPRQPTPSTWTGPHRQVMDGVVITTPKYILRSPDIFLTSTSGSPSPSQPVSSGKLACLTSQNSPRPPVSVTVSPSLPAFDILQNASILSSPKPTATSQRLPRTLPSHLVPHLHSQKQAVLEALHSPPAEEYETSSCPLVFNQLTELVKGTTQRNEGNSCLILGPRGSGKSRLVDRVLAAAASTSTSTPIIVRLSAHCQTNDRLAMREIARQIHQQMGSPPILPGRENDLTATHNGMDMDLPASSLLPGMISALPGLGRPVVIVLDGFDGFAAHARQALLYCLLDTVQSCHGGSTSTPTDHSIVDTCTDATVQETVLKFPQADRVATSDGGELNPDVLAKSEHGLLVIGITSRVDCLTLLEKRVKSRFSHRIMRVGTPPSLKDSLELLQSVLSIEVHGDCTTTEEWNHLWMIGVKEFLADKDVFNAMNEIFAFGKDLRILFRLLIAPVIGLTANSPWLTASQLVASMSVQRCPKHFPFLTALPYPHVALLIAAAHTQTAGHSIFNFEMLHDKFMTQVRVSVSAPVQADRGGLGMVNVTRGVMFGAFEHLVATHVFQPIALPSAHITKEFVKYRCVAAREEIKGAVEQLGQTNLKKWFSRNQ